jgi:hypothetical protein
VVSRHHVTRKTPKGWRTSLEGLSLPLTPTITSSTVIVRRRRSTWRTRSPTSSPPAHAGLDRDFAHGQTVWCSSALATWVTARPRSSTSPRCSHMQRTCDRRTSGAPPNAVRSTTPVATAARRPEPPLNPWRFTSPASSPTRRQRVTAIMADRPARNSGVRALTGSCYAQSRPRSEAYAGTGGVSLNQSHRQAPDVPDCRLRRRPPARTATARWVGWRR